jgi:hypothetical protein
MSSGELPGLQNRRAASLMSPVRSTRTRFRQFSITCRLRNHSKSVHRSRKHAPPGQLPPQRPGHSFRIFNGNCKTCFATAQLDWIVNGRSLARFLEVSSEAYFCFFPARTFAHRFRCAAAMRLRPAAEIVLLLRPSPDLVPRRYTFPKAVNAAVTRCSSSSSRLRSF